MIIARLTLKESFKVFMHETKEKLDNICSEIDSALKKISLEELKTRVAELTTLSQEEGFWDDQARAQKISKKLLWPLLE